MAGATIAVAAGIAFILSTEPVLSPTGRFRVIMVAILGQSLLLYWVLDRLFRQHDELIRYQQELRSQHRAATYINTLTGLWRTLEIGLENGGLDPDVRRRIYAAGEEQLALYREALAQKH